VNETPSRQQLIEQVEHLRGSRVLVYVTGDRAPFQANIGDDAVRPMIDHLRSMEAVEKLDVIIYSRGGAIDVPWRMSSAFRRTAKEWDALIPFRANSAATLLSLGADHIVMGKHAELGPIDPIMQLEGPGSSGPTQNNISVEDVMAFPRFVSERFDLADPESRVAAMNRLVDRLDAVTLGGAFRTHTHIRYLAEKMLGSRNSKLDSTAVKEIVATLAEKVYAHGHAIGLEEAQEIGLHVEGAEDELDVAMWKLLSSYERDLKLLEPLDVQMATDKADEYSEPVVVAVIESLGLCHEFGGTLVARARRQMPQSLQVQVNVPVQLPMGVDVSAVPPAAQQVMQVAQQALPAIAHQAVLEALRNQAPRSGIDVHLQDARWRPAEVA
jgi:hypothetical protein